MIGRKKNASGPEPFFGTDVDLTEGSARRSPVDETPESLRVIATGDGAEELESGSPALRWCQDAARERSRETNLVTPNRNE